MTDHLSARIGGSCSVRVVMSLFSFIASGMRAYLITLYPAWISMASRWASRSSCPLWLESSSSITARTLNDLSVRTKSALFCEKLYRLAPSFAVSSAPKLTCIRTTCSGCGKHSTNRQNMPCSLAVASALFPKRPLAFFPPWSLIATPAINAVISTARSISQIVFIFVPPFEAPTLCDL